MANKKNYWTEREESIVLRLQEILNNPSNNNISEKEKLYGKLYKKLHRMAEIILYRYFNNQFNINDQLLVNEYVQESVAACLLKINNYKKNEKNIGSFSYFQMIIKRYFIDNIIRKDMTINSNIHKNSLSINSDHNKDSEFDIVNISKQFHVAPDTKDYPIHDQEELRKLLLEKLLKTNRSNLKRTGIKVLDGIIEYVKTNDNLSHDGLIVYIADNVDVTLPSIKKCFNELDMNFDRLTEIYNSSQENKKFENYTDNMMIKDDWLYDDYTPRLKIKEIAVAKRRKEKRQ